MYYSIIEDGKFVVVIADGIAHATIIELPTEELADEVAYQLQSTWDEAEEWGKSEMEKKLDHEGYMTKLGAEMRKFKSMTEEEIELNQKKHTRQRKAAERKLRKAVLTWKERSKRK